MYVFKYLTWRKINFTAGNQQALSSHCIGAISRSIPIRDCRKQNKLVLYSK